MPSHIPLFLKYRPQNLDDLVGQDSFKEIIRNAIESHKLVNAYLLTGPKGSGKTSSARILAKCLNCDNPLDNKSPSSKPCGKCPSCISIANSSSIDVVEIDAASHGGVEDARNLIEKVQLASVSGKYRIYIIDEVHMLSKDAFNALLKVFEEPPEKTIFILATTEEDKVIATIKSRCQQFRFRVISPEECFDRLEKVAKFENINIEKTALEEIVKRSDGALRDALGLLDQVSVFSEADSPVTKSLILDLLGGIHESDLEEVLAAIINKNPPALINKLEDIYKQAKDPVSLNKELSNYCLNLLDSISLDKPVPESFTKNSDNYELSLITTRLFDIEFKLKTSSQSKNILKATLVELCYRKSFSDSNLAPLTKSLPETEIAKPKSISKEAKKTSSPASNSNSILDHLNPSSRGIFISSKARLIEFDNEIAKVVIPTRFKFLKSKLEDKSDEILDAISQVHRSSRPKLLNIELEDSMPEENSEDIPQIKKEITPEKNNESLDKLDEVVKIGIQSLGAKEIKL